MLCTAGSFNPSIQLDSFLPYVAPALCHVTSLVLNMEDTDSTSNTSMLDCALQALVGACPAILSIDCSEGRLSSALWPVLGVQCPLLSRLKSNCGKDTNSPFLQQLVNMQPVLLPHLNTLVLQDLRNNQLPDMSLNVSMLTLCLPHFRFEDSECSKNWLHLPSRLRHLQCFNVFAGPLASSEDGTFAQGVCCL